jgi:catechol 2,3-dioxygenase-like lactoylglutathione lyase family enzyme
LRVVLERVELHVADVEASRRFYATVLGALGGESAWGEQLVLAPAAHERATTHGLHVGFGAASRGAVDAFWRAGVDAGHRDDGPPGPRPQYVAGYYGAFLLDPDGNSAEAVHYDGVRADGVVDHLWIRVAQLDAARRWYDALADAAGWQVQARDATRWQVVRPGTRASFALVADGRPATLNAQLAVRAAARGGRGRHVDPDGNRVELV